MPWPNSLPETKLTGYVVTLKWKDIYTYSNVQTIQVNHKCANMITHWQTWSPIDKHDHPLANMITHWPTCVHLFRSSNNKGTSRLSVDNVSGAEYTYARLPSSVSSMIGSVHVTGAVRWPSTGTSSLLGMVGGANTVGGLFSTKLLPPPPLLSSSSREH